MKKCNLQPTQFIMLFSIMKLYKFSIQTSPLGVLAPTILRRHHFIQLDMKTNKNDKKFLISEYIYCEQALAGGC